MKSIILALIFSQTAPALEDSSPCMGKEPNACEIQIMEKLIDVGTEKELCAIDRDLQKAKYDIAVQKAAEAEIGSGGVPGWVAVGGVILGLAGGLTAGLLISAH